MNHTIEKDKDGNIVVSFPIDGYPYRAIIVRKWRSKLPIYDFNFRLATEFRDSPFKKLGNRIFIFDTEFRIVRENILDGGYDIVLSDSAGLWTYAIHKTLDAMRFCWYRTIRFCWKKTWFSRFVYAKEGEMLAWKFGNRIIRWPIMLTP